MPLDEIAPIVEDDGIYGMYEPRLELAFAYPFGLQRPRELASLSQFLLNQQQTPDLPTLQSVEEQLARGDLDAARLQSLGVIEAVYALPPVTATPLVRSLLWPALEVFELAANTSLPRPQVLQFLDRKKSVDSARLAPALKLALDAIRKPAAGWPCQRREHHKHQNAIAGVDRRDLVQVDQQLGKVE